MMINIRGEKLKVSKLDKHIFICDLIYIEGSVLSLFRYKSNNWLYLWCDTDNDLTERWLLFPASRESLVKYLNRRETLLQVLKDSSEYIVLDLTQQQNGTRRLLRSLDSLDLIQEYLPTDQSYFDESLAPDISLAMEVTPGSFTIPIDGMWFFSDLDKFSGLYSDLYAFFYCTKPRFITNIGERVEKYISSPWMGGYSRIKLFKALGDMVPSLHDLQIKKISYASPGEIIIEALDSVGKSITNSIHLYLNNEEILNSAEKSINSFLATSNLKRSNLSTLNDSRLSLTSENLIFLHTEVKKIIDGLSVQDEFSRIVQYSPNIVVTAKVVLSLLVRVKRISEFKRSGQITL